MKGLANALDRSSSDTCYKARVNIEICAFGGHKNALICLRELLHDVLQYSYFSNFSDI
jgi:hypothetical protein